MPYCQSCGTKLKEDQIFCPNCGAKVQTTSSSSAQNTVSNPIQAGNDTKLKISAESKAPIVILIFALVSFLSSLLGDFYGVNMFTIPWEFFGFLGRIQGTFLVQLSILVLPFILIIYAVFALSVAKKRADLMLIPTILGFILMAYSWVTFAWEHYPVIFERLYLVEIIVSLTAFIFFAVTVCGKIRFRIPTVALTIAAVVLNLLLTTLYLLQNILHTLIAEGSSYAGYSLVYYFLFQLPLILFFVSMILTAVSVEGRVSRAD